MNEKTKLKLYLLLVISILFAIIFLNVYFFFDMLEYVHIFFMVVGSAIVSGGCFASLLLTFVLFISVCKNK